MATRSFKDLIVWQESRDLSICVYKEFRDIRDYGFKDQIQRATISIMNNIAEGHAKRSDKGFRNFLLIALGSAAELESMLLIAVDLHYINQGVQAGLLDQINKVSRLLNAFIKKLTHPVN